jgi:hypothetical protein
LGGSADALEAAARRIRFERGRRELEARTDDVWVATYPRSGTTWMLYLLHLLRGGGEFDHIDDACPWFERGLAVGTWRAADLDALPSPRIFKTHLLPRWVPRPGRVVYVERDGLAVAASYHALYRDYFGFGGGFEAFFDRFVRGDVQYGAWFAHVQQWRDSGRTDAWVRYEDLRADPERTLTRVAQAIGLRIDASAVARACEAASRDRMRAQQSKFDHATALLRERGITPGAFIRATGSIAPDPALRRRLDAARDAPHPRARLGRFLR